MKSVRVRFGITANPLHVVAVSVVHDLSPTLLPLNERIPVWVMPPLLCPDMEVAKQNVQCIVDVPVHDAQWAGMKALRILKFQEKPSGNISWILQVSKCSW